MRATSGLYVSTEIGVSGISARKAFNAGTRRAISASAGSKAAFGLVDSAPMSIISAPSCNMSFAWERAAATSEYFPPSEKESSETFNIPIIRGLPCVADGRRLL